MFSAHAPYTGRAETILVHDRDHGVHMTVGAAAVMPLSLLPGKDIAFDVSVGKMLEQVSTDSAASQTFVGSIRHY